jgi:hypothetical protein
VGLNAVDGILGGVDFRHAGLPGILFPILIVIALMVILGLYLRGAGWKKAIGDRETLLNIVFMGLILCLISVSSVTIRQEFRWLMSPFLIFVLVVFRLLATYRAQSTRIIALVIFTGLILVNDGYYRQFQKNIYFMYSLQIADTARTNVLDHYTKEELSSRNIVVVTHGDETLRTWILFENAFVNLYVDQNHSPTIYVDEVRDIPNAIEPGSIPVIIDVQGHVSREIDFQSIE